MSQSLPGPAAPPSRDSDHRRRNFRLGPSKEGTGMWSPMPQLSAHRQDTDLPREAQQIRRVVRDRGPVSRDELHGHGGARFWKPRRFLRALHYALNQGLIRSTGRDTYNAQENSSENEHG